MLPCPRRAEAPMQVTDPKDDVFEPCCSYCGSMNPDRFMELLEAGQLVLGATDKDYKVYVSGRDGQHELNTREIKFYFQHLSEDQQRRFVDLWNADLTEKKLFQFLGGFRFYVMPFFMRPADATEV